MPQIQRTDNCGPSCSKVIDKVDMFGSVPPSFNLEGKTQITTTIGFLSSILTYFLMISFAGLKWYHL